MHHTGPCTSLINEYGVVTNLDASDDVISGNEAN